MSCELDELLWQYELLHVDEGRPVWPDAERREDCAVGNVPVSEGQPDQSEGTP